MHFGGGFLVERIDQASIYFEARRKNEVLVQLRRERAISNLQLYSVA